MFRPASVDYEQWKVHMDWDHMSLFQIQETTEGSEKLTPGLLSVPDRDHAGSLLRGGGSGASTGVCDLASSLERRSACLGSIQAPGC